MGVLLSEANQHREAVTSTGWLSVKAEARFDEEESCRFGRLILHRQRDWLGVSNVNLSTNPVACWLD
jgi:hypothetical protein